MSTMQYFYTQLCDAPESGDAYLQALAELSHASLAQIAALQSDLMWEPWGSEAAEAA